MCFFFASSSFLLPPTHPNSPSAPIQVQLQVCAKCLSSTERVQAQLGSEMEGGLVWCSLIDSYAQRSTAGDWPTGSTLAATPFYHVPSPSPRPCLFFFPLTPPSTALTRGSTPVGHHCICSASPLTSQNRSARDLCACGWSTSCPLTIADLSP